MKTRRSGPPVLPPGRRPVTARMWARLSEGRRTAAKIQEHREKLAAGATGRVLDLGAGTGANFRFYPPSVTEVVAVEPEPYLRRRAEAAAARASVPITVVDATADPLPFDEASFDVAVVSLVLCSVDDQPAALNELSRVLRPGGELRFYEHVVSTQPARARVERFLDRTIWPLVAGGCHVSRDTLTAIRAAGFEVVQYETFESTPVPGPRASHILGLARRP